jgi:3-oxoadipate enol-lactonase
VPRELELTGEGGLRLAAEVEGEGEPVVLVHGLGFSRKAWRPQIDALTAAGWRCVSYDLRGFGASEMPRAPYRVETLAADLEAVRAALGLDRFHLVGHSMGGMVSLGYAVDHPERVRSLFLASTTSHNGKRASLFARVMSLLSRDGFDAARRDAERWREVEHIVREVEPYVGPVMDLLRKLTERADPGRALAWAALDGFSLREEVKSIRCPTLVMHGDRDPNIPFPAGMLLAQAVAGAKWIPLAGARHNLPLELTERFNAELLAFLGPARVP